MVRYCTNPDCPRYQIPLTQDAKPCPECGSVKYRLNPDVATVRCRVCDAPNAGAHGDCWRCSANLEQQTQPTF